MSFSLISLQYIRRIVTFPLHPSYIPRHSSDETDNALSLPGLALHFVVLVPDASIALVFTLSAVLLCFWNYFFRVL
jgi:hypothetical protein